MGQDIPKGFKAEICLCAIEMLSLSNLCTYVPSWAHMFMRFMETGVMLVMYDSSIQYLFYTSSSVNYSFGYLIWISEFITNVKLFSSTKSWLFSITTWFHQLDFKRNFKRIYIKAFIYATIMISVIRNPMTTFQCVGGWIEELETQSSTLMRKLRVEILDLQFNWIMFSLTHTHKLNLH